MIFLFQVLEKSSSVSPTCVPSQKNASSELLCTFERRSRKRIFVTLKNPPKIFASRSFWQLLYNYSILKKIIKEINKMLRIDLLQNSRDPKALNSWKELKIFIYSWYLCILGVMFAEFLQKWAIYCLFDKISHFSFHLCLIPRNKAVFSW